MTNGLCRGCGRMTLEPSGPPEAEVLFVGDAPTGLDLENREVWSGPAGDVMRAEFRRAGIRLNNSRITNMWQHPKTKDCDFEAWHLDVLLDEMRDRRVVVLMGADACKYFTGENVSDLSGLRAEGDLIPDSVGALYVMFNPALALHDRLGELRHAVGVIAEAINQ